MSSHTGVWLEKLSIFIVTCSDGNKHLCVDAFKRSRIVYCYSSKPNFVAMSYEVIGAKVNIELAPSPLLAFQKPPGDALCCPVLEQLILQKLPLNKECMQHVQKFLRRVHPTAAMIKQLSFSRNRPSALAELYGGYLEVSGATLGSLRCLRLNSCQRRFVLGYSKNTTKYFRYKENGEHHLKHN